MFEDKVRYIKECLQKGKNADDIKNEMNTNGMNTDDFDECYDAATKGEGDSTLNIGAENMDSNSGLQSPVPPKDAPPLPTVTQFVRLTFKRFLDRSDLFLPAIGVMAVSFLPILILIGYAGFEFFETEEFDPSSITTANLIVMVSLFLLGIVTVSLANILNGGALLYAFSRYGERPSYGESLSWSWKHIISLAWIGILASLTIITGMFLFIIPGLLIAVYVLFSKYLLATEERRGVDAMVRSTELIKGVFWGVIGRVFILALVVMVISGIVSTSIQLFGGFVPGEDGFPLPILIFLEAIGAVIQLLASWIVLAGIGLLLEYRRAAIPAFEASAHNGLRWTYRIMATIGGLLMIAILALVVLGATLLPDYVSEQSNVNNLEDEWYLEGVNEQEAVNGFE